MMSYFPMQAVFCRTNDVQVNFPTSVVKNIPMNVSVKGASVFNGVSTYSAPAGDPVILCTDLVLSQAGTYGLNFKTYIDGALIDQGNARQTGPNSASTLSTDDVSWGNGTLLSPRGEAGGYTSVGAIGDLVLFGMVTA